MSLLEVRGLGRTIRGRALLSDFNLSLDRGTRVGLLGPNGAGKTTCFGALSGRTPRSRGTVRLNGQALDGLPPHLRARRGLVELPQNPSVFRGLTVAQNIDVVLELRTKLSARERSARVTDLLQRFGLASRAQARVETLSGGERRRLEIARTLALPPKVLLLDEPFAGVDPLTREELSDHIRALAADGMAVLIADHNARSVLRLCEWVVLVIEGRILVQGPPEQVAQDPAARAHYLGQDLPS